MERHITLPAQEGDEFELDLYLDTCPILDGKTTKRVHMQVVIVWAFYNYPDITNKELTQLIKHRFPKSNWMQDHQGRATTDRRKYNQGMFRCMGGWQPEGIEDAHYAVAFDPRNEDDETEEAIDE